MKLGAFEIMCIYVSCIAVFGYLGFTISDYIEAKKKKKQADC